MKTETLSLYEFLDLPNQSISEMASIFKAKNWLTLGANNAHRKDLREWAYDQEEKVFFTYRNSKKHGQSWTGRYMQKPGTLKSNLEIVEKAGFILKEEKPETDQLLWSAQKADYKLTIKKFPDMAGFEVFQLILSHP